MILTLFTHMTFNSVQIKEIKAKATNFSQDFKFLTI